MELERSQVNRTTEGETSLRDAGPLKEDYICGLGKKTSIVDQGIRSGILLWGSFDRGPSIFPGYPEMILDIGISTG